MIETGLSRPDHIDDDNDTALILACKNKFSDIALKLIETNISLPENVNDNSDTALIIACKNNMSEVALKIIEKNHSRELIEHVDNADNTALMYAFKNKMHDVCNVIFDLCYKYKFLVKNLEFINNIKILYENHLNKFDERLLISKTMCNKPQEIAIHFNLINELIRSEQQNVLAQILNVIDVNIIISLHDKPYNLNLTRFMNAELKNKLLILHL